MHAACWVALLITRGLAAKECNPSLELRIDTMLALWPLLLETGISNECKSRHLVESMPRKHAACPELLIMEFSAGNTSHIQHSW
jgi:hypothetical protein